MTKLTDNGPHIPCPIFFIIIAALFHHYIGALLFVIPAQAGIQSFVKMALPGQLGGCVMGLDCCLCGNDGKTALLRKHGNKSRGVLHPFDPGSNGWIGAKVKITHFSHMGIGK